MIVVDKLYSELKNNEKHKYFETDNESKNNYLPKFDIKIEMAEKSETVKIDETQKDDSFLTETTEIVNNTISKNKKIEEKTSKPANELSAKEEKTNPSCVLSQPN